MKVGAFLKSQFEKSGIDLNNEEFKAFVTALDTLEPEVPEKIEKGFGAAMISIKDAKNNYPEIMNHYKANILDGADQTIKRMFDEFELPQDLRDEVNSETSPFKRIQVIGTAIKKLEQKKVGASRGDKKEIDAQIDRLNLDLKTEKEARQTDQKTFKQQMKDFKKNIFIDSLFSGTKTKFDDLDADIRNDTLRTAFMKHLQDNNGKIDLTGDDENGSFQLFRADGTNYYSGANTPVTAKQLAEKMLADKKLLIQSGRTDQNPNFTADQSNQGGNQRNNAGGASDNQNKNFGADKVKSLNAGAMKDYETGMKNAQPQPR